MNARAIKDAGFEYVYIQSSRYSSTRELRFSSMVDRCLAAGLSVGAYHFCSHGTDPEQQAEFFYKASGGLGKAAGELPPMLDWEYCTPTVYNNNPAYPLGHPLHCVRWIGLCANAVTNLWYPNNVDRISKRYPVLYTYPAYSISHQPSLEQETGLGVLPLAYASYKSGPVLPAGLGRKGTYMEVPFIPGESDVPTHSITKPWTTWKLWQYSGNNGFPVPGVVGACDRQVFNGSSGEWDEFRGIQRPVDSLSFNQKAKQ